MRQPEFGEPRWRSVFRLRWSWTLTLVATYVVVLLAEEITAKFFPHSHLFFGGMILDNTPGHEGIRLTPSWLALSKDGIESGWVWQLLTYQFLHAGWLHLILNSWVIIVFGTELEHLLGARRYLALMFSSGIVGGVFQVLMAMAWPAHFGGEVVGASAGAFGLVAAFAMIFPERELTMFIFFIIPLHLRARTLLLISLALAVVGILFPMGNIANAAHLGGMAMGWFYVKMILKNPALLGAAEEERYYQPPPVKRVERPADEFEEGDVDAVLDKISARGINSLTARERGILEAARKKIVRR